MTEPAPETAGQLMADDSIPVLDHGFVRLDAAMADDLSVVNAARVSFARRRTEMSDADAGLIRFLMRDRHGTPFEHNSFRFHIRCPIFVAREWFRHRIGCLTGDTSVTFVEPDGEAVTRTIDELWSIWTDEAGGQETIRRMGLRILDEASNVFGIGEIAAIVEKGVQPVFRMTLSDGKALTLTENHRVLTRDGWGTLRDAVGLIGDGRSAVATRTAHVVANGIPAPALVVGSAPRQGAGMAGHLVAVTSVEYVGVRQTFDLVVDGPWHNFVANGMVVHNSFNEFSMRYAKATDEFYVPELEDVRSQVGKPGAYTFEPVDPALAEATRDELQTIYEQAYAAYTRLVEQGVARELARSVLPVGAYTEFYWTVNARALMNFLSLRNAETAQREIRRFAAACETFLEARMPITHAAFVANDRHAP